MHSEIGRISNDRRGEAPGRDLFVRVLGISIWTG